MPTLHELQRGFRASMLTGRTEGLEDVIVNDAIAATDRLCIYRNTARSVLTDSLRLSYPAVDRLVGRDLFRYGRGTLPPLASADVRLSERIW